MLYTPEEFVLLLRKWATEPIWVSVVIVFQRDPHRGIVHLSGCVSDLDEANSRVTVADENNNLASFSYADCQFLYESLDARAPEIATRLPELTGQEYEELAHLVTPSNTRITIYKAKQ